MANSTKVPLMGALNQVLCQMRGNQTNQVLCQMRGNKTNQVLCQMRGNQTNVPQIRGTNLPSPNTRDPLGSEMIYANC